MFHLFNQYYIFNVFYVFPYSPCLLVSQGGGNYWVYTACHCPLSFHLRMLQDTQEELGNNGVPHVLSVYIQPAAFEQNIKSGIADYVFLVHNQGSMTSM